MARLTGRAFVTRNTIHWAGPPPRSPDDPAMPTVIHELAHCWQHQTGRRQLTRGALEQLLFTLLGWWLLVLGRSPLYDPYDYGGPDGLAGATSLRAFRLEAQATIIEDYWRATAGGARCLRGHTLYGPDGSPTPYARDLARLCRGAGIP